jgi:hypothetical protein
MKNHRTLVRLRQGTPAALGARLASAPAPARSHLTTRSRSPFPGGKSLGTVRPGHHEAADRPIGECLVIDVADRTAGTTTIMCLLITIQGVR